MKVTFIEHSSYYVELERCILLFDYARGSLPAFDDNKPLYVFISHRHSDHFTPAMFSRLRGHHQVHYILSDDIQQQFPPEDYAKLGVTPEEYAEFFFVSPNHHYNFGSVAVDTLPSTDEGVAFIIYAEARRIYFAGDLHLWLWSEESDEEWNAPMQKRFEEIMAPMRNVHFDVAFLPLDPRQGGDFFRGFDYFMRLTQTDAAFPMHFWDHTEIIDRLIAHPCSVPYRSRIYRPGFSVEL